MIHSKEEYIYYLQCDKVALKRQRRRPPFFSDYIWKYEIALRRLEYFINCYPRHKVLIQIQKIYFYYLAEKTGFSLGPNIAGPGLSFAHTGRVIVNNNSIIGKNCRFQTGVTIGTTNGSNNAPVIGNNVFFGEGVKVIGNVRIADDVQLGANAVVIKDITEPGTTWGGVPAKKISNNNSSLNLVRATEIVYAKNIN